MEKENIPFNINEIKISKSGKPYFINNIIKFNYSHSKNYIACVISNDEIGIDIEDEFKISKEAVKLYLNNEKNNLRYKWVKKEAYFKYKEYFDDEEFKKTKSEQINENYYVIDNEEYTCITFYKGTKQIIFL